jgi:hypothetical protein
MTAFCVSQLSDSRRTASVIHYGDAFVAHSRNAIVDTFLSSPCEWLLQIDDDMLVPFGNANWFRSNTGFNFSDKFMGLHAIDRLMSHKKTVVGALYFGRTGKPGSSKPVYGEGSSDSQEAIFAHKAPHDLCKPTRWVGTGCLLTHRSVFEAIEKKFPRLSRGPNKAGGNWFTSTEASLLNKLQEIRDSLRGRLTGESAFKALEIAEAAVALAAYENPLGSGEDVSFCLRAAAAGHQPFIDMGLVCGHVGYQCFGP